MRRFATDHLLTGDQPTDVCVRFDTDSDSSADMLQGLAPALPCVRRTGPLPARWRAPPPPRFAPRSGRPYLPRAPHHGVAELTGARSRRTLSLLRAPGARWRRCG
ncbi:hypothetical protein CGQ36_25105 [Nocardiopsis dassonvillei]|nr:hypothetical protein CGQ36_25105 [Nocardiopsis dassonvillei]